MSPVVEPTTLSASRYSLYHIGPKADVWPSTPNAPVTVLGRTDMVSRPLPSANLPSSPDFVSGSWTGRLGDAGTGTLVFPNATASDGPSWRQRFKPDGHNQFIAILDNGQLDFVGCITQVQVDQQKVTVQLADGWFLLKKAYVRDWVVTQSPRDVIERGTQVWVPLVVDDFPAGALNSQWTVSTASGGSVSVGAPGGLDLAITSTNGSTAAVQSAFKSLSTNTGTWRATCSVQSQTLSADTLLALIVSETGTNNYYSLQLYQGEAQLYDADAGATVARTMLPASPTYSMLLESDGEWIMGFVNGKLLGGVRRAIATTPVLAVDVQLGNTAAAAASATVTGVLLESLQPLLMRGADVGDRVQPGSARAYPHGGLTKPWR